MKTATKFKLLSLAAIVTIGIVLSAKKGSIMPLVIAILAIFFL